MKKIVITITALIIAATGIILTCSNNRLNELSEANVEALATTESLFGPMCSKTGTSGNYIMKYCPSCTGFDRYALDVVAFCPN